MRIRAVASLAILKVNWDHRRDYIQNFVPFVLEALRVSGSEVVSIPEVQAQIAELFSLHIPQGALRTILKRAGRDGAAVREHGVYRVIKSKLKDSRFSEIRESVKAEYDLLILDFREYCIEGFGVEATDTSAEVALEQYLASGSIDLLLPALSRGTIALSAHKDAPTETRIQYLLSRFISEACKNRSRPYEFLVTIVKGRMLADVLYYPMIGKVSQRFGRVSVYLDTTLLLRGLGFSDVHLQAPCKEMLEIMFKAGLSLRCFAHTYDEVVGILRRDAKQLQGDTIADTYGETLRYFLDEGYSTSDVELEIAHLQERLNSLRIQVERKPKLEVPLGVDEKKLEDAILDSLHYWHARSLYRDIDSVTAVYRLRRGQLFAPLENCRAIFITTNIPLAWSCTKFFQEEYGRSTTPVALPDHVITTLLWLKNPSRLPDLPEKRIIADCYAAMNPSDKLWKKYATEIEKLRSHDKISHDDYYVLRSSMEARLALMDITSGDPDVFTQGTAKQVLQRAREGFVADERALREAAETRAASAERRTKELEQQVSKMAIGMARWCKRILFLICFSLLGLATYAALPKPLSSVVDKWPRSLVALLIILLAGFGFINLCFGTSVRSFVRKLEIGLATLFRKILEGARSHLE